MESKGTLSILTRYHNERAKKTSSKIKGERKMRNKDNEKIHKDSVLTVHITQDHKTFLMSYCQAGHVKIEVSWLVFHSK